MKNNKGITLIALVVTIIVLLILAGVSIAMLTGDNGILTNSQKAKRDTMKNEAVERITIALNAIKTEVLAQYNTKASYDPTTVTDSGNLVVASVIGFTATGTDAPTNGTSETGYYVVNSTATDKKITITYTNKEEKFSVTGSITFTSPANGGTISTVTAADFN